MATLFIASAATYYTYTLALKAIPKAITFIKKIK